MRPTDTDDLRPSLPSETPNGGGVNLSDLMAEPEAMTSGCPEAPLTARQVRGVAQVSLAPLVGCSVCSGSCEDYDGERWRPCARSEEAARARRVNGALIPWRYFRSTIANAPEKSRPALRRVWAWMQSHRDRDRLSVAAWWINVRVGSDGTAALCALLKAHTGEFRRSGQYLSAARFCSWLKGAYKSHPQAVEGARRSITSTPLLCLDRVGVEADPHHWREVSRIVTRRVSLGLPTIIASTHTASDVGGALERAHGREARDTFREALDGLCHPLSIR